MTISIKLSENTNQIEKKINTAISQYINNVIAQNLSKISQEIKNLIPVWIKNQPEINALLSRELIGQFGILLSPQSIVNAIIDAVLNSTSISFKKYNDKLSNGGLEINIQPRDFSNLLSLDEGHTIYSDGDLHWLQWMLFRGDEIIIIGYEYNPQTGLGRTKLGNMKTGSGFRIPPQYSGTVDNNFITRALVGKTQEDDISKIIKKILS